MHRSMVAGASSSTLAVQHEQVIGIPRTTLLTMIDNVDRCAKAAAYAVTISQQARNAFEEEHQRLQACAQELRDLLTRGILLS